MSRFIQSDGASKGHPRMPFAEYGTTLEGHVGSPVLNEAQLIQRGVKTTATQAPLIGPKRTFTTVAIGDVPYFGDYPTITDNGQILVTGPGSSYPVRRSLDGGLTWNGWSNAPPRSFASLDGTKWFGHGNVGFPSMSRFDGSAWVSVNDTYYISGRIRVSLTGSRVAFQIGSNRMLRISDDYGATFAAPVVPWTKAYGNALPLMSPNGQRFFVRTETPEGAYKSTDGGVTWQAVPAGYPSSAYAGMLTDDGLIVVQTGGTSFSKSMDNGVSWTNWSVATLSGNMFCSADAKTWISSGSSAASPARVSIDYAATWEPLTGEWGNYAGISPDGKRLIIGGSSTNQTVRINL